MSAYHNSLHCLECGYTLGYVGERDKRTVFVRNFADKTETVINRGILGCPICGAEREFTGIPVDIFVRRGNLTNV